MVRKSIGLALLAIAVLALVLTALAGSATATVDPFQDVPYYLVLPNTGQNAVTPGGGLVADWVLPALVATGSGLIAVALLRFRLRRR